jgi:hypothetical protein
MDQLCLHIPLQALWVLSEAKRVEPKISSQTKLEKEDEIKLSKTKTTNINF